MVKTKLFIFRSWSNEKKLFIFNPIRSRVEVYNGELNEMEEDPLIVSTGEIEHLNDEPRLKRKKSIRSDQARLNRNRQRNHRRRRIRYLYCVMRLCYHRYTCHRIRVVLKQLGVDFGHIKLIGRQVIIGMRNQYLRDHLDDQLPLNIFDRAHFFSIHYEQ